MEWLRVTLLATARWVDDFVCALPPAQVPNTEAYLLGAMLERLDALMKATPTGQGISITPYTLDTSSQMILDKDTLKRVRDVSIWVDSAVDGPEPTLRIGTTNATPSSGVRLTPGQVNTVGIIPADSQLYASSDQPITVYVIAHF